MTKPINRKMCKISMFCSALLVAISGYGQNLLDPEVWKDYHPSTPEVGKLIGYVDTPVDYTRGVANISIPLYVIETGGISIPITLNYNHKGIKPTEQTMMLGLGWSLQAAPQIARAVNGQPDIKMNYNPETPYLQYKLHANYLGRYLGADGQPDQYHYRLCGKSGSYLLVPQKTNPTTFNVVTIPYDPVRINCNGQTDQISITDERGTVYHFGGAADAVDYVNSYTAVWKANRIICPNHKDSVMFEYAVPERREMPQLNDVFSITYDRDRRRQKLRISNYNNNWGIQEYYVIHDTVRTPPQILKLKIERDPKSPTLGYTTSLHSQNVNNLSTISYTHGKVIFNYDINKSLNLIQVKDVYGNNKRNIYLYHHRPKYGNENYVMLDSVVIKDENEKRLESYKMAYSGEPNLRGNEKCVNFWGYFTGLGSGWEIQEPLLHETKIDVISFSPSLFGDHAITIPGRDMTYGASTRGVLKSIVNQSGGITEYFYESDQYVRLNADSTKTIISNTGGLRIKRIKYTDPDYNESLERLFKYGQMKNGMEDEMGIVRKQITPECYRYKQYIEEISFTTYPQIYEIYTYTSNLSGNWTFNGDPVAYDRVSEYRVSTKNGVEINNGKTVYTYYYPLDSQRQWSISDEHDWIAGTNIVFDKKDSWKYGYLTSKSDYTDKGVLVSKTEYTYGLEPHANGSFAHAWRVFKDRIYWKEYKDPVDFERQLAGYNGAYTPYSVWGYDIVSGCMRLMSQKEYQFSGNTLTKTMNYTYGNKKHGFPTAIETVYNDGMPSVLKNIKYTEDDKSTDDVAHVEAREQLLKEGNISAIMEETITIGNTKQVNSTKYKKKSGNNALPYQQMTQRDNNFIEERASVLIYDSYGNPLHTTEEGTKHTVYIWGYKGRFPIAVIQNATYTQVGKAMGGEQYYTVICRRAAPNDNDWERIEQLRTSLPQGHVSIYKYDDFFGNIIWSSDPRGIKTYFDYDGANRLIRAYYKEQDAQGIERERVIETHDYQYRNF